MFKYYSYLNFFTLLLLSLFIYGCSTPFLFEAASGEKVTISKTPLKVISAIKEVKEVIICINTKDLNTEKEKIYNFSIPLDDESALKQLNIENNKYLTFEPKLQNVREGCNYQNNNIEIVEYKINNNDVDKASLIKKYANPNKPKEVVYVIYRDTNPIQLGYISTNVIFNDIKNIDVPIHQVYSYEDKINLKPYLYLLTPLAIAADIYIAAPFFAGYCLGDGDLDCQ